MDVAEPLATAPGTAPSKGRPRAFDYDTALAAALRVFWRHGYDGSSLTMLTEAMGIARPSLYAAFGNKQALFTKAFDRYERDKLAYIGLALDAPTAYEVARRLLHGTLALQTGKGDPRGCLAIASAVCGPEAQSIRAEVSARRASSTAALTERLERAAREGDLPAGVDPAGLARHLLALIQGIAAQAAAGASPDELASVVETGLAIWPGRHSRG